MAPDLRGCGWTLNREPWPAVKLEDDTFNEVYAVIWSTAVSAERIRAGCRAAIVAASSPARMARMACRWMVR